MASDKAKLVEAEALRLAYRVNVLQTALERCIQTLETCDAVGAPHPTHDAVIAGLAKVCGSGEMMKAIVLEWRNHFKVLNFCPSAQRNHFTVGPTRQALEDALRVGRAALEQKT